MPLGDVSEQDAFLAAYFGGDTSGIPASFDVALFTDDPTDDGVEITGGGYARVTVTNDATFWTVLSDGKTTGTVTFPDPTGDWDGASFWVMFNGTALTAYGRLSTQLTPSSGDPAPSISVTVFLPNPDNVDI